MVYQVSWGQRTVVTAVLIMLEVAGSLQKTPLCSENLPEVTWNQYNGKGEGGEGEEKRNSHTKPQKTQSYLEDMLKITE